MKSFMSSGVLPSYDTLSNHVLLKMDGFRWPLYGVQARCHLNETTCWAMLAYDDQYSICYFGTTYRHGGGEMVWIWMACYLRQLKNTRNNYRLCFVWWWALKGSWNRRWVKICCNDFIVYRQCLAAHKLVADAKGCRLSFQKKISVMAVFNGRCNLSSISILLSV